MLIRYNSLTGFKNNTESFNNFRKLGNTPSDIEHYTYFEEISLEKKLKQISEKGDKNL